MNAQEIIKYLEDNELDPGTVFNRLSQCPDDNCLRRVEAGYDLSLSNYLSKLGRIYFCCRDYVCSDSSDGDPRKRDDTIEWEKDHSEGWGAYGYKINFVLYFRDCNVCLYSDDVYFDSWCFCTNIDGTWKVDLEFKPNEEDLKDADEQYV